MSLWKKVIRGAGRGLANLTLGENITTAVAGPPGPNRQASQQALPPVGAWSTKPPRGQTAQLMGFPVLPGVGAILRGAGGAIVGAGGRAVARGLTRRGLQRWSRTAARNAGYIILGGLVYDLAGNLLGEVPRRRMNPLNHRALSRAIRRVCAAKSICMKVTKITGLPAKRKRVC